MNPLHWVRWKVVAVLAVVGLVVYLLGLDKVALSKINTAGKESKAARWSVSGLALGLIGGDVGLEDILVATPASKAKAAEQKKDDVLSAAAAKLDLSVLELLGRRYVVDQVAVKGPKMTVTRRDDGSINIEDFGEKPEGEPSPAPGERRDWLETAKKWYERVQKVREKAKHIPHRKPREPGYKADYSRGVEYPFEGRPTYAVHELLGTDFEVQFSDEGSKRELPSLTKGTIKITEVTSAPDVQEKPTGFELSGEIAGALLKIGGTLDLRGGKTVFDVAGDTGDFPVSLIEAFVGPSLPVSLKSGTVRVALKKGLVDGAQKLDVVPHLSFKGLSIEPKDPRGKIAGFDAAKFAAAFNEASKELPELVIEDLRISGSLASPSFEWGDTVKNLVLSGGKAFVKGQTEKAIQKGLEKGKEALEKSPAKDILKNAGLGDKVKDVDAKDVLKKGLDFFGGPKADEKAKEAPPDPKK